VFWGLVVESEVGQCFQYCVQTTHCASSPFFWLAQDTTAYDSRTLSRKLASCADFMGKKRSFFFCLYTLGRDLVSILSRARMLHIEHRALGQKRILPGAWLLNSPKMHPVRVSHIAAASILDSIA
jgi:hypothetical protein